jgi:2'-5' RNA ligase
VPLANQHVTLKFLGATWPRLVGWVEETVRAVAASRAAFEIRVEGLGAFPSERRARVLWAGLEEDGSVGRLAAGLEDALAREFRPEARAFTPHLTLARFEPAERLTDLPAVLDLEPFVVERIVLFRSHLRRPAPIYEPLRTFELGVD